VIKNADGRAALRCCPVEVVLGGQTFRITARPTYRWILKIIDEDWLAIVPGMVGGEEIVDLIRVGNVGSPQLVESARDAVSVVCGMPWWAACRLAKAAASNIEIVGAMTLAGVDPEQVSIGAYLAAVYRLLVEQRDDKQRSAFDRELMAVPQGVQTAVDKYDPQAAGAQFERFAARYGG
jgi:hypothetical protein